MSYSAKPDGEVSRSGGSWTCRTFTEKMRGRLQSKGDSTAVSQCNTRSEQGEDKKRNEVRAGTQSG